jgi:hypothetical protein
MAKTPRAGSPGSPLTQLAILMRNRPDVLAALRRTSEDLQVLIDRRHADRRAMPVAGNPASPWAPAPHGRTPFTERRRGERRRPLAATWETMGFVIVPAPA